MMSLTFEVRNFKYIGSTFTSSCGVCVRAFVYLCVFVYIRRNYDHHKATDTDMHIYKVIVYAIATVRDIVKDIIMTITLVQNGPYLSSILAIDHKQCTRKFSTGFRNNSFSLLESICVHFATGSYRWSRRSLMSVLILCIYFPYG